MAWAGSLQSCTSITVKRLPGYEEAMTKEQCQGLDNIVKALQDLAVYVVTPAQSIPFKPVSKFDQQGPLLPAPGGVDYLPNGLVSVPFALSLTPFTSSFT